MVPCTDCGKSCTGKILNIDELPQCHHCQKNDRKEARAFEREWFFDSDGRIHSMDNYRDLYGW